ncbi:hypothetical protein NA57DRAFT_38502 [Rhizodiscina lignyota]|uniref:D-serine dehydratase n=1 Tax=Rhizodiscina lignyota TaxID=1504668 RepID=A0A9P4MA65_9PEZI|nr:hypothetical protein NA57DRAFT_38502 [Rhizodiscina lignyota]
MLYPMPSQAALQSQFVGKRIEDLTGPAAILDVAVARNNCSAMLKTVDKLKCHFRAHVKTHKTLQLTELQVPDPRPLRLIASTIAEIENLMPLMLESLAKGREVDMLYGVPFCVSAFPRIAELNRLLMRCSTPHHNSRPNFMGPLSVLVDHPAQLEFVQRAKAEGLEGAYVGIFIKIDTGYHRAGVSVKSESLAEMLRMLSRKPGMPDLNLRGFYSHLGHSYGFSTPAESVEGLIAEIRGLSDAVFPSMPRGEGPLLLSVGATPTATSAQNLLALSDNDPAMQQWHQLGEELDQKSCQLELHAGVYPLLDLQQVATGARPSEQSQPSIPATLSTKDIGLRILVEVASTYSDRAKPEALIPAGNLALGREPCKSYPGWGIVTPWRASRESGTLPGDGEKAFYDPARNRKGWIVGRVSQEHGMLTWESGDGDEFEPLNIGQKLLVWPNHACIAAAGYGWYYVVDSESEDSAIVRDVWVRWRGW